MRLNPAAFNAFLSGNIGQNMDWRKGHACPCFNPVSGAALPGHLLCAGKGWIWDMPMGVKAGINSSGKDSRQWAQMGQWEAGDVILTVPGDSKMYNVLGRFDRVELKDAQDVFKLTLTRGLTDRLYVHATKFTRVFWLDPNNNQTMIDGGMPNVDAAGNLTWPNDDGPPAGLQYSIAGMRYVDYFVWFNLPSNRNEHFGAALPQKAWLRRFDLFGR